MLCKTAISSGSNGVLDTLKRMASFVHASDAHREIKAHASRLIHNAPQGDLLRQASTIFYWVRDNVRYIRDISGVEEITSPWTILNNVLSGRTDHSADCDDHAILLSSLLRSVGFPTRFTAIASGKHGKTLDHVRVDVLLNKYWYPLEATIKNSVFGLGVSSVSSPLILYIDTGETEGSSSQAVALGGTVIDPDELRAIEARAKRQAIIDNPPDPRIETIFPDAAPIEREAWLFSDLLPSQVIESIMSGSLNYTSREAWLGLPPAWQAAYKSFRQSPVFQAGIKGIAIALDPVQIALNKAAWDMKTGLASKDWTIDQYSRILSDILSWFTSFSRPDMYRHWKTLADSAGLDAVNPSRPHFLNLLNLLIKAPITLNLPELIFNAMQEGIAPDLNYLTPDDALKLEAMLSKVYNPIVLLPLYRKAAQDLVLTPLQSWAEAQVSSEIENIRIAVANLAQARDTADVIVSGAFAEQSADQAAWVESSLSDNITKIQDSLSRMQSSFQDKVTFLLSYAGLPPESSLFYLEEADQKQFWKEIEDFIASIAIPFASKVESLTTEAQKVLDSLPS
jgi:hypothetical protein